MNHRLKFIFFFSSLVLITGCSSKRPSVSNPQVARNSVPATMKPYTIKGKTYYPKTVAIGDTQKGIASWYGPGFHRKKTSNGENYDMYAQTAAHKTFPMNTMVKVTNLANHKSTVVRINDRGPFVDDRIIDLSKKVALQLDVHEGGTAPVKLEVVGVDKKYNINPNFVPIKKDTTYVASNTYSDYSEFNKLNDSKSDDFSSDNLAKSAPKKEIPDYTSKYKKINEEQKINKEMIAYNNFYVQIGSFENPQKAYKLKNQHSIAGHNIIIKNVGGKYKALVAGFTSKEDAREFAQNGKFSGAFVTK